MNFLITGIAGFIGSNLGEYLIAGDDVNIIGLDNFDDNYSKAIKEKNLSLLLTNPRFKFYESDIRNVNDVERVFAESKIDCVIHLAAKVGVRPSMQFPEEYFATNVSGTEIILEAMHKHKVKNLVFASSSSIYGANEKVPFSETDATDNIISVYADTKLKCEQLTQNYNRLHGFSVVNLRFFTVYGPRQRPDLAIHQFFKAITEGKSITVFGNGETSRDYTFVSDIVSGISAAAKYVSAHPNCYETINLGNHNPVNLLDLIKMIESVTGKKAILEHKPIPPGDVPRTYADITKAKALLNFSPATKIEDGLKLFYEWYRKQ